MTIGDLEQLDITGPEVVEIRIRADSKVVWINVDGICRLRACQIKNVILIKDRNPDDNDMDREAP